MDTFRINHYSLEDHRTRGAELFCDFCNNQWPDWYLRIPHNAIYPSYCICQNCGCKYIEENGQGRFSQDHEKGDEEE